MTVGELFARMDSREFSYWMAIHRYYWPIGGEWEQTGLVASAILAPYCGRGKSPKVQDFIPVDRPPQHQSLIDEELRKLKEALGR